MWIKKQNRIECKKITSFDDHNSWEEQETSIDSFTEMKKILDTIGFKDYFSFEKKRNNLSYKQFNIAIEDITNFGACIEVEVLTSQEMAAVEKENIKLFLESCGISDNNIVPKSVTNILMRKNSRFDVS